MDDNIVMSNTELHHLSSGISEIKLMLEKQNGRIRENEKAIAVNSVLNTTLKEQMQALYKKLDEAALLQREVWAKFEILLNTLDTKVDALEITRAEDKSIMMWIRSNGLSLLTLISVLAYIAFGQKIF